jgi:hypothetical protein
MTAKPVAWLNLRYERQPLFATGLQRLGYEVRNTLTESPREGDILVTWNRIQDGDRCARIFSDLGFPVVVVENATWGNWFAGEKWYTMARDFHNVAGKFPIYGNERWDSLNVELAPFREEGETVILPSRGIGPSVHRMPSNWVERMRSQYADARPRLRAHPGQNQGIELMVDLRQCCRVVTWGSGAAVKALIGGIKVDSYMPDWIGACENTEMDRLAMLRSLAWGQVRLSEIESGAAFERVLAWAA